MTKKINHNDKIQRLLCEMEKSYKIKQHKSDNVNNLLIALENSFDNKNSNRSLEKDVIKKLLKVAKHSKPCESIDTDKLLNELAHLNINSASSFNKYKRLIRILQILNFNYVGPIQKKYDEMLLLYRALSIIQDNAHNNNISNTVLHQITVVIKQIFINKCSKIITAILDGSGYIQNK